jgi:hypothetical protein
MIRLFIFGIPRFAKTQPKIIRTVLGSRFMLARRVKGDTMEELHRANRKAASQQA